MNVRRTLAASSLSILAVLGTVAPASTSAAAGPSEVALTWAPEYMSPTHQFTQAQAIAIAQRFDVVAAMPVAFAKYASAMRTAHPGLKLLAYSNAMYASDRDYTGLSEAAFAHDANGRHITSKGFGLTMMEPSSPEWRNKAVSLCQGRMSTGGYDGCLLDMLTMAAFVPNYNTALPVAPGTSSTYAQTAWRNELIKVGQAFPAAMPGHPFTANAIGNYYSYWHNPYASQPIAANLSSSQMEDFLRGSADLATAFPGLSVWLDNVNTVADMEAMGKDGYFSTKVWVGQTAAQTKQWQAFAMSSFLMAANGHSYFAFTPSRDQAGATGANHPYQMPKGLGAPTSAMTSTNGLYERTFANGLALVNPGNAPIDVTINQPGTDLDGNTVTTFTLAPSTGQVLRAQPGSTTQLDVDTAGPDTTNVDTVHPTAAVTSRAQDASRVVTISGTASDDVAVASVTLAVYSYARQEWYNVGGTFGPYSKLPVTTGTLPSNSTTWSYSAQLPAGTYGYGLLVQDTSRNGLSPSIWQKFTVS